MPQQQNTILNSLKYLGAEAYSSGEHTLGQIIETAVEMGVMFERLEHLDDNTCSRQDMTRIMTFMHFYRTAAPDVQRQVYALMVSKESKAL